MKCFRKDTVFLHRQNGEILTELQMPEEAKPRIHPPSSSPSTERLRDLSGSSVVDWDEVRAKMWDSSFTNPSERQNEPQVVKPDTEVALGQEQEQYRHWIGVFANSGSDQVLGKFFAVGCDIFFLMQFTYLYCFPGADPLDEWARKARSMRAVLPDYIRKIRRLSRALKRLETPDRLQVLGKEFKPEAQGLERYALKLEAAFHTLKQAGTKGSMRPFYLLSMSHYLGAAYPERWRGQWMKKTIHADIRDLVNAGFRAHDVDRDLSEDQVRHLCGRFSKRYPEFAKLAEEYSKKLPRNGIHVLERLFQDSFPADPDISAQ